MIESDVAIVGAGPAGLVTALQLRRYRIPAVIFEERDPGGLLLNANLVENYPGFPQGIPGIELARLFIEQAHNAGVGLTYERVLAVKFEGGVFNIRTEHESYQARVLVIAAGTQPKPFPEQMLAGVDMTRVNYEFFPLRHIEACRIAIIGAGDAAFDYALSFASRGNQVIILHRSEELRCLPLLWERASANERISCRSSTWIEKICSTNGSELRLDCETNAGKTSLVVNYLVGALGRTPRMELLSSLPDADGLQAEGRLHIVGDIHHGIYRQTAIAVGDGLRAAMKIYERLKGDSSVAALPQNNKTI